MQQPTGKTGSSAATVLIAIYMMALSLVTLCPSITIVGCGGILGSLTSSIPSIVGNQNYNNGLVAANVASGLIVFLGVLGLMLTAALIVVGIALLTAKPWAWMGSIVLNAVFIGLQLALAGLTNNIGAIQVIFIILSGGCIFLLVTNKEIKATFGKV